MCLLNPNTYDAQTHTNRLKHLHFKSFRAIIFTYLICTTLHHIIVVSLVIACAAVRPYLYK